MAKSPVKSIKALKQSHTSNSKIGMGDNYGTGVKQKVGRMREDMVNFTSITPSKLKKPPKSLA